VPAQDLNDVLIEILIVVVQDPELGLSFPPDFPMALLQIEQDSLKIAWIS
jgi:hypothetical protein